ncbi:hypothetical protein OIO90_005582 [Microbotryomycetes sp. JL221]|nr:hypothetical protein OIO90_005582 [Microbotryomycetes sp. JL221]
MDDLINRLLTCPGDTLPTLMQSAVVHATVVEALAMVGSSSSHAHPLRRPLHQLVSRMATSHEGTLTVPLLAVYCNAFIAQNKQLVQDTIQTTFDHDAPLQVNVCEHAPLLLAQAAQATAASSTRSTADNAQWTRQALMSLLALARSHPLVSSAFGQVQQVYTSLSQFYSSPSIRQTQAHGETPDVVVLDCKFVTLTTVAILLDEAYLSPMLDATKPITITDREDFWLELITVLDVLLQQQSQQSKTKNLIDATLLQDLLRYYKLRNKLELAAQGLQAGTDIKDRVFGTIKRVRALESGLSNNSDDGLELLRRSKLGGLATQATYDSKGKARAPNSVEPDHLLEPIKQILDILPDQHPTFLRTCLLHPAFSAASSPAEAVIAALLEGSLPQDLKDAQAGSGDNTRTQKPSSQKLPTPSPPPAPLVRRNVFDDDKMDLNKLRRGKAESNSTLMNGSSIMSEALKAAIIARAERESSDEDEDEQDLGEAFIEDQDEIGPSASFSVRDGELEGQANGKESAAATPLQTRSNTPVPATSSNSTKPNTNSSSNPFTPVITSYLEQVYLDNPSLFSRDSQTRKSKARDQLRQSSGLSDDRIEEFARMIERNPNKDTVLNKMQNKHEFKGNHQSTSSSSASLKLTDKQRTNSDKNASDHSGTEKSRGGGNTNRGGRGGAGRGGSRGSYSGGKMAHERRVRGNDRKMQKMGIAPQ